MKKIICFALLIFMILSVLALASCTVNDSEHAGDQTTTTTPPTTTEPFDADPPKYVDPFEGKKFDFKGTTVRFAIAGAKRGDLNDDAYRSIDADENNGDPIVESVYTRNKSIEERINVVIDVVKCTDNKSLKEYITPMALCGDDRVDWMVANQKNDIDICFDEYVLDLARQNTGTYTFNYIDINNPWWSKDYIDKYQFADELYWLSGPISLKYLGGMSCVFVNEDLYNEYLKKDHGSLADLVLDGNWTVDQMAKMCADIYKASGGQVNGVNMFEENDVKRLMVGAGFSLEGTNEFGGKAILDVTANSDIISKVKSVFSDKEGIGSLSEYSNSVDGFVNGKQLFMYGDISKAYELKEMNGNLLEVPMPKLDKNQEEYRCLMSDDNQIMGLMYTSSRIKEATVTLELMAADAYANTVYKYYDNLLDNKFSTNYDTFTMVSLILDSAYIDFGMAWENGIYVDYWRQGNRYLNFTAPSGSQSKKWQDNLDTVIDRLF